MASEAEQQRLRDAAANNGGSLTADEALAALADAERPPWNPFAAAEAEARGSEDGGEFGWLFPSTRPRPKPRDEWTADEALAFVRAGTVPMAPAPDPLKSSANGGEGDGPALRVDRAANGELMTNEQEEDRQ
ncbi:MAG TPA: hypothetical protein VJL81_11215 [Solirubrobacterales bacterium]|nr:hypothetical protein [Solirubrobacterales bacterium]